MPTKQVIDRQKAAGAILSAGQTHAGRITAKIEEILGGSKKKNEGMPDMGKVVELAMRRLAAHRDQMVLADQAHEMEHGGDGNARNERDAALTKLSAELVELREWLQALFGADELPRLGFRGPTPQDPVALERYAGEVAAALRGGTLPTPKRKGVQWDPEENAASIEKHRSLLRTTMADVATKVRESEATRSLRNAAIAEFDETYRRTAALVVGLLRYAGEDELAARVRPSVRRAAGGGEGEESDLPDAGGGAHGDGASVP